MLFRSLDVSGLLASDLGDDAISSVVYEATSSIETVGDLHATASYRKRVGAELAIRALRDARSELKSRIGL